MCVYVFISVTSPNEGVLHHSVEIQPYPPPPLLCTTFGSCFFSCLSYVHNGGDASPVTSSQVLGSFSVTLYLSWPIFAVVDSEFCSRSTKGAVCWKNLGSVVIWLQNVPCFRSRAATAEAGQRGVGLVLYPRVRSPNKCPVSRRAVSQLKDGVSGFLALVVTVEESS